MSFGSKAQSLDKVYGVMSPLTDQFNKTFAAPTDELVIIWVPGNDDPFNKIYEKWKGKTFTSSKNVQVVGGFKEMVSQNSGHGGSSVESIKKHIADALISRYGTKHFPILLDMNADLGSTLSLSGLSIIVVSKKTNAIKSKTDFGSDRKKFLDEVNTYFNPQP